MSVLRRGVVASFEDGPGLGVVTDGQSGEEFPFHCTAVADGSRTIAARTEVVFVVAPGQLGRDEAVEVMAVVPPR